MAKLWTDVIDPATLTGFARAEQAEYEAAKGSLARWLPNQEVADVSVRFMAGSAGLVPEARYRAFDAEPEFGSGPQGERVTIDLVALSQQGLISERDQLRLRSADDETRQRILMGATRSAVRAIVDRAERMRGTVLVTGKATIAQDNYADETDYGRDASMTVTAGTLWSAAGADPIGYLTTLQDQYVALNGVEPGAIVMSRRVLRALGSNAKLAVQLLNGQSRPATESDVRNTVSGAGLPEITLYDRRTKSGRILPDDTLLLLPEPVDPVGGESELGATFWGQSLAASEPDWQIEEAEQPGIVAAAFTNQGIPPIKHTYADSLNLPVLANANLSLAAKVL